MPLATPNGAESIDFEVEASSGHHSSDFDFTTDKPKPSNLQRVSKRQSSVEDKHANVTFNHRKLSRTSRLRKATAPDPDETSLASVHSPKSHSALPSSSSSTVSPTSASPSHGSSVCPPTSFVSSTFPTVTTTTLSLSASHPHLLGSRQVSASVGDPFSAREISSLSQQHPRSPRVDAVLRSGGPSTRGRHSISPMAPDAARAPPRELLGPPRYLRERGLAPSRSSRAATTARSPHTTPEKRVSKSKNKHSRRGHGEGNISRTPSRRSMSNGRSSGGGGNKRDHASSKHPYHSKRIGNEDDDGVSTPSDGHHLQDRSRQHSDRSHDEECKSSRHNKHRDGKEQSLKDKYSGMNVDRQHDRAPSKDARLRTRGPVVAPTFNTLDAFNTTLNPSLKAPALTVQDLEEEKTLLEQKRQQPRQQSEWSPPSDYNSVSFRNPYSKPATAASAVGERVTDIRAPPPRATSPSHRQQHRHLFLTPTAAGADEGRQELVTSTGIVAGARSSAVDEDTEVDLRVPVLSAHRRKASVWPTSFAVRGNSGLPEPAAWSAGELHESGNVGGGATASSPHRYEGWEEEERQQKEGVTVKQHNRHRNGPPVSAASPQQQQQPVSRPANPLHHPSHRFGLPSPSADGSTREQPTLSLPAAKATTTNNSNNVVVGSRGGSRFSASPQLAGTSPVLHSYVAQSFDSYLPGHSTVLTGNNGEIGGVVGGSGAEAQQRLRVANNTAGLRAQTREKEAPVRIEVAVLAERVDELPSPALLEHYDALLKNYKAQQRQGACQDDVDVAALFSLIVHVTLPSETTSTSNAEATLSGGAQHPRQPVTIGDVKDEIALRTGIPSTEQCLVYEAMSLQDTLPIHLLISADDEDFIDENDDVSLDVGLADGLHRHCLRLLCVTLKAHSTSTWPLQRHRHTIAGGTPTHRGVSATEGGLQEVEEKAGDVEELKTLLLLSPARRGVSSASTLQQQLQQQQQSRPMLGENTEVEAPPVRRGAVPFTLSQPSHTASRASEAVHQMHHESAPSHATLDTEQEATVLKHIDRLRRLYLKEGGGSSNYAAPTVAAPAAATIPPPAYATPTSAYLQPREYLFNPHYQLSQTGCVEHADPVVHALQQQLLLNQLTAPSNSSNNVFSSNDVQSRSATVSAAVRGAPAATLSDSLIAALPAPPVRQSHTQPNGFLNDGWLTMGGATPRKNNDAVISAATLKQQPQQQHRTPSTTLLTAQSRFATNALPTPATTSTSLGGGKNVGPAGSHISVIRRTVPRNAAYAEQSAPYTAQGGVEMHELDLDDDDRGEDGVRASWLESSRGSEYAASATAGEVDVVMSQAPSTLDY